MTWGLNAAKLAQTRKSRCVNQNAFKLPAFADQGVNFGTQTLEISSFQRLFRLNDPRDLRSGKISNCSTVLFLSRDGVGDACSAAQRLRRGGKRSSNTW